MVRVNLISPSHLSDQHLQAEYQELLMFIGYVKKHPSIALLPGKYQIGEGHMKFFKDKLGFVTQRHRAIRKEMERRNMEAKKELTIGMFKPAYLGNWEPDEKAIEASKFELLKKLEEKSESFTYEGKPQPIEYFIGLLRNA